MNIGLKKWFSKKTKKELIELCYQLHLQNLKLKCEVMSLNIVLEREEE